MSDSWKTKYMDIRAKLIRATDTSYRLGMEAGLKQGKQMAMEEQQAMQAQQAAVMGGAIGPDGQPMQQPGMEGQMPPGMEGGGMEEETQIPPGMMPEDVGEEEGGTELDQHMNELEDMVAKGEKPSILSLRNTVTKIAKLRKSARAKKKIEEKIVPAQKKIVDNIMKKWEKDTKELPDELSQALAEAGVNLEE